MFHTIRVTGDTVSPINFGADDLEVSNAAKMESSVKVKNSGNNLTKYFHQVDD